MKWLKISFLLLSTLALMRLCSWMLRWLILRTRHVNARLALIISNLIAFGLFLLLLYSQWEPGEPFDMAAAVFAAAVFLVYGILDAYWVR